MSLVLFVFSYLCFWGVNPHLPYLGLTWPRSQLSLPRQFCLCLRLCLEKCLDYITGNNEDGHVCCRCSCWLCGHVAAVQHCSTTHRRYIGSEVSAERRDLDFTMCWRSMGWWDRCLWAGVNQHHVARRHPPWPHQRLLQHVLQLCRFSTPRYVGLSWRLFAHLAVRYIQI